MLNIPETIYEQELTDWLFQQTYQNVDKFPELPLLLRLSKAQMKERHRSDEYPFIANFRMSEEECGTLLQYTNSSNIQIRAYCKDVCHRKFNDYAKMKMAASASDDYLYLYSLRQAPWFLLRSVTVRNYKPLRNESYIYNFCDALSKRAFPSWMPEICSELKKSYTTTDLKLLSSLIVDQLQKTVDLSQLEDERSYLEALKEIGYISPNDLRLKKALSYESELDYINAHREANTIYANNVDIIQNAYNEIYEIRISHPAEYDRIKRKLLQEQQTFNQDLRVYGIKTKLTLDSDFISMVEKDIKKASITEPLDAFDYLRRLPFIPKKVVEMCCIHIAEQHPVITMFGSERLGERGQTIGVASPEDSIRISAYKQKRLEWCCIINRSISEAIASLHCNDNEICQTLYENCTASYIRPHQVLFWAKGLTFGLKGDMISAVHILTPQIERSLVNKAESIFGNLSALHREDRQNEPGLSKALECLKPYFKEDIYNDLRFFLNTGADVNLRNCVAHGLCTPQHFVEYGAYLWWIALKMYFCEAEIFFDIIE